MNNRRRTSRRHFGNNQNKGRRNFNNHSRGKETIDIATFIKQSQVNRDLEPAAPELRHSFEDFNLDPRIQTNLKQLGFHKPTPIQDQSIQDILLGKDLLGIANTGTGKTGAFLIPVIQQMIQDPSKKVLVVAPTRELAGQINDTFISLSRRTNLYSVECIGGTSLYKQVQGLQRNWNAVIGTPGRLIDLTHQRKLDFSKFNIVILDEVDRMLDMGFVNDVRKILSSVPQNRQTLYFSATIDKRVSNLINEFSSQLQTVSVKTSETAEMVFQEVVKYEFEEKKLDMLHDILISQEVSKTLIFGRTKHGVKKLMVKLRDRGFRTDSIHGNKTQNQRQKALQAFKHSHVDILVATDVAARGLDVDDVSHVINYDIPASYEDYIHRIGRTGRQGKKGTAYTFVK